MHKKSNSSEKCLHSILDYSKIVKWIVFYVCGSIVCFRCSFLVYMLLFRCTYIFVVAVVTNELSCRNFFFFCVLYQRRLCARVEANMDHGQCSNADEKIKNEINEIKTHWDSSPARWIWWRKIYYLFWMTFYRKYLKNTKKETKNAPGQIYHRLNQVIYQFICGTGFFSYTLHGNRMQSQLNFWFRFNFHLNWFCNALKN